MVSERKKVFLNLAVSGIGQVVLICLGLIVPKIILSSYGSDVNGLTNTIGQVFTYISLLEAGVSVSARNALYKPIKEGDENGVSFICSLAKKYYKRIAISYFAILVLISFGLPFLLKTSVPYWTVCFYIFFEGLTSVLSFYFINTWTTFLRADGKNYVVDLLTLVTKILCYAVKITLSLFAVNIAFIQIGYFLVSMLVIALYFIYMKRKFPWIQYNCKTEGAKLPEKGANLISEIAWTVFSSTDLIILSVFVSTTAASVYSVYNMIYVALNGLLTAIFQATNYKLGLAYNSGDIKRYIHLHDLFNSLFLCSISSLMAVTYFLIIPFVSFYTAGVTDTDYIIPILPLLFCMVQILSWSRCVGGNLIGISFRQKQAVPINVAEALINITASLIFVHLWGIIGVLLATVVALPLKAVYCNYISDVVILKRKPWRTILIFGTNYFFFGLVVLVRHFVHPEIKFLWDFVLWGALLSAIFFLVSFVFNVLVNKELALSVKNQLQKVNSKK